MESMQKMSTATVEQVYSGSAHRIADRILRGKGINHVDADDIVQLVAIENWKGRDTPQWDSWMAARKAKGAITQEKATKRGGNTQIGSLDAINEAGRDDSPLERLVQSESSNAVRDAISRLPVELQRVIELRFFRGMTFREMAFELTGNPTSVQGAVTKLKRAIEMLSDSLSEFA